MILPYQDFHAPELASAPSFCEAQPMTVQHPSLIAWEATLDRVIARLDDHLETRFGAQLPRRPGRPPPGETARPEYDGLFAVDAAFTPGYGTPLGRGYVVRLNFSTLSRIPPELRDAVEMEAVARLREWLPEAFPDRALQVDMEGPVVKISGDLRLGPL